jgi:chromosome segregation ATPase
MSVSSSDIPGELEKLRAENKELTDYNRKLIDQSSRFQRRHLQLAEEVTRLRQENAELRNTVKRLEDELKAPLGDDVLLAKSQEIDANVGRLRDAFERRMALFAECAELCGAVAGEIGELDATFGQVTPPGD